MKNVSQLKTLPENCVFETVLMLKSLKIRQSKNGSSFLQAQFCDKTDSFVANIFESNQSFYTLENAQASQIFQVKGKTEVYNGNFSPKIDSAQEIEKENHHLYLNDLIACSANDPLVMKSQLEEIILSIENEALRDTVNKAINQTQGAFFSSTAAISMHHAYKFGLLEHTLSIAKAAKALFALYPEVNKDLALAGIILHDIGKTLEYTDSLVTEKTKIGILQGHIVLGYRIVRKAAKMAKLDDILLERLEHIILSHQGQPLWGAAVFPATSEAIFVSLLDNLDAKMAMVQNEFRKNSQKQFSEYMPGLESKLLLEQI